MRLKTTIDSAGRIVIPRELRKRYGFDTGRTVEIIPTPDGVSIVAERRERRFVRRGAVLCIDTGAGIGTTEDFDVDALRDGQLDAKQ